MFELIRANKRRSLVLVFVMLLVLLALGFAIGAALLPSLAATEIRGEETIPQFRFNPVGGIIGMGVALVIWFFQAVIAYFQGARILMAASRARPIEKADHPQLFNVVEEMCIAAALPKMPQIYIMDDMALNAFAAGRDPDHAIVAVTAGLLAKLDRDELQGVIAHEVAHIVHRDVLFMTMIGVMVGSIVMISEIFLRGLLYGSMTGHSRRYRSSDKKGGGGIMIVIAIVLAIVAPILAQFIYFAISRRREYLADAGAAVYTRYPEGLASALETLAHDTHQLQSANKSTAPMYIINPLHKEGAMALNLTRTHPPLEDRIKALRGMAGGVSYANYATALGRNTGSKMGKLPASLQQQTETAQREASAEKKKGKSSRKDARQRMRDAGDLLRNINEFVFLACACGMRIKLPPEFKQDHVACPRCKNNLQVPTAQLAAAAVIGDTLAEQGGARGSTKAAPAQPTTPTVDIARSRDGWTSFKCQCGAMKNIAPACTATKATCGRCKAKIALNYV
jgi:heat shock protein HtpX